MSFAVRKQLQRTMAKGVVFFLVALCSACLPRPATNPVTTIVAPPPPLTATPTLQIPIENAPTEERVSRVVQIPQEGTAEQTEDFEGPVAALPDYYESHASYYAKRFNGRRTYTGERYDPDGMTAATRDFPLQSWLKVVNPANGSEVTVRINDLTGKRKTPLVDLSRAAAKRLGFLGKGKIHVHIIPLSPPQTVTLTNQ